ncbi:hypothetical protein CEXT_756551 [Caerostris extrusa]|uniref:Uncharacterized protein n=1 Tax=Caerostris extrusa TaxID=172846 RepID=A0AAV4UH70_CAEEX|nr:hypothetical protein CEXT_756551 [Caerostris extrusa]
MQRVRHCLEEGRKGGDLHTMYHSRFIERVILGVGLETGIRKKSPKSKQKALGEERASPFCRLGSVPPAKVSAIPSGWCPRAICQALSSVSFAYEFA